MNDAFYIRLAAGSQIVASILFIALLVYIWVRFISPGVARSQARKNAELAEAEQRRDRARDDIAVAQREGEAIDREVHAINERAQADAQRLHERLLVAARAEGERLIRNAEGELERGRLAARDRIRHQLVAKATQIARGAALYVDESTNRRLIGETLDTVDRASTS